VRRFSRRNFLIGAGATGAWTLRSGVGAVRASEGAALHGLTAFGDLQLPPDFKNFAYVNTAAPKGGGFTQLAGAGGSTFNSLNAFIL
jgi:microcin C transport system substrate-binding protein